MSLFLFFPLVSVIFAGFSGGCVTAEQRFCCVFTRRHKTPTKAFRSLGVCRVCAMMWRGEATRLGSVTGLAPGRGATRSGQDVCVYVLKNSEGPAVSAWVSGRAARVEIKKKIQLVEMCVK